MGFDLAGKFLEVAAQKFKLAGVAKSSLACERARKILAEKYPDFCEIWIPQKFENGKLTISVKNSAASSELFLRTHEILEVFEKRDFPERVEEIVISRESA